MESVPGTRGQACAAEAERSFGGHVVLQTFVQQTQTGRVAGGGPTGRRPLHLLELRYVHPFCTHSLLYLVPVRMSSAQWVCNTYLLDSLGAGISVPMPCEAQA